MFQGEDSQNCNINVSDAVTYENCETKENKDVTNEVKVEAPFTLHSI